MAEKPMDLPLSNLLENYASLRDMNRKEFLPRKSKICYTLELLRIILILAQLIKLKDEFEKRIKKILDEMEIARYSWHLVEESIKNYFYKILSEKDDSVSVQMMFSTKNHADDPPLAIRENQMSSLLKRCEEVIVDLVKDHHSKREFESEEHSTRCVICLNEKALINIVDGGTPSFKKSIQVMVPNRPSIEQDRVSESLDQVPTNGHKTNRQISKEKAHQRVSHLEGIAGSKSKIACEVIRDYTTEEQCETALLEEEDQTHSLPPDCSKDQMVCEVVQECTTEEKCETVLLEEEDQIHLPPPECPRDQMVCEVVQECTTEEKCEALLLEEEDHAHLPHSERPEGQMACEVVHQCTTEEKCEAVLLEEDDAHLPPPECPRDQMVREVVQECTTEEKCEALLLEEEDHEHLQPSERPEDQMVCEVIQESTTEEKCEAALRKEGAQTHLPPPECPRDQTVGEVIPGCTTQEKCEASLLEGARTHPPPPGFPEDQAQEQQLKKLCESCIDYDKKLCRSDELLTQEKQLVVKNEKEKLAVEETCAKLSRQITILSEENQRLTLEAQETQEKYQEEINHISQAVDEMNEKEKLLINQKLEIAYQVETLESSLAKAKEDLEDNKKVAKRDQNIQNTEIENLSKKLKSEKAAGEQLKLKLEDTKSRLNTELAAANENQKKIKVLESTIEQNDDEKQSLLERGNKINVISDPEQKESPSNEDYQKFIEEIEERNRDHKRYWDENKKRMRQENKKRLIGQHKHALTYHDVSANKIVDKVFRKEQDALKWAHKNKHLMDENMPFIRIWALHKEQGHGLVTTEDLKFIDIMLIDPSGKKRNKKKKKKKVVSKGKGMFDTGADIASVPYRPKSGTNLLIHSVTKLNDKWMPVVYGQLIIDGEMSRAIYPIELEEDIDWWAIGLPQIRKLKSRTSKRIIKKTTKVLTSE